VIAVENEIAVTVAPAKVWQILTDFARYRDWHPFIRLTGEARAGAAIDYEYTSVLRSRRKRHSPAVITRFERNVAFEWTMGVRRFFQQVERYELAPHPLGTRLRHRLEYRGAVAILFSGKPSNAAHARLCEADGVLRSLLAGKNPASARKAKARDGKRPRR